MKKEIQDNIVDDLLTKRPVGPGKVTVVHLEEQYYHYTYNMYKTRIISSNVPYFGYDPKVIFNMSMHSQHEVERYIRKRFYDDDHSLSKGRKIGLSRKVNRLWNRIESAVIEVKRQGSSGIYLVTRQYGGSYGHLHADSKSAAQNMAKLFYGFLYPKDGDPNVEYIRDGTVEEMKDLNNKLIEQFNQSIAGMKREIARKSERINRIENIISVVATVEEGQANVKQSY